MTLVEDLDESHIPFKKGDPQRKRKILELFSDGQLGPSEIARMVGGTESSVRQVRDADKKKRAAQEGSGNRWYESITDKNLEELIDAARTAIPKWNTEIADTATVRDITQEELTCHTYPHTIYKSDNKVARSRKLKAGRRWMQARLTDSPKHQHHGFVIFPPAPDTDYAVVNDRFTKLLDETNYQKKFHSIFQSVQGKKGRGASMGDNKRKQAKMSQIAELARLRVQEAKVRLARFADHTVSENKTEARATLRETEAEQVLVHEVIQHMCENYNRVQEVSHVLPWLFFAYQYTELKFNALKVWPSEHNMPKRVGDADGLACLESLTGAKAQGFHRDTRKPGATAISSYEQDQFIYVLFFAFCAMRILEELRKDRREATAYVRSRLAAGQPESGPKRIVYSNSEWEVAEPRIWQFLVHEEFRVRGVRRFEVVRVPIRKDHTGALDTRCPHGGAPWDGARRAYRGHFYGYERDLQKQTTEQVTTNDEYVTVDLCDDDFSPIVGWAQLDNIFKRLV